MSFTGEILNYLTFSVSIQVIARLTYAVSRHENKVRPKK